MIKHGSVPDKMLLSTLVPIPKNPRKSGGDSDNYRAIALSSIIGKILDQIILCKNLDLLQSCDLQFGFKRKHSTTQCTFVIQEVIDYYTRNNTPVYLTLLDASKAFDRVEYTKLFGQLIQRKLCPCVIRLLIFMYTNQYLCTRWNSVLSSAFECNNGVKQGGVLSPILFCVYMDDLLYRLSDSKSRQGCYIGNEFVGAFGYADDLCLIAPSRGATVSMIEICEQYAQEYHVKFNATKSFLIKYNVANHNTADITLLGNKIDTVKSSVHLGHFIGNDSNKKNITKAVSDLISRTNYIIAKFGFCYSHIKAELFNSYCNNYYGSPLWNLSSKSMTRFYVAWRKCVRRVWGIPNTTHCAYLPYIHNAANIEDQLLLRFAMFYLNVLRSDNCIVRLCGKLCQHSNSNVGENCRLLACKTNNSFPLSWSKKVLKHVLNKRCQRPKDMGTGCLIRELCQIRDGELKCIIECELICDAITMLCTE